MIAEMEPIGACIPLSENRLLVYRPLTALVWIADQADGLPQPPARLDPQFLSRRLQVRDVLHGSLLSPEHP
jgi:hypothetical protein